MAIAQDNLRKAAVLLLSLPKPQRKQLLDRLLPRQAAAVTAEMARLASEPIDATEPLDDLDAEPFAFLHHLPTDALLDLMAEEQPQTIAMVLSYLPPQEAAAALADMTPEQQFTVVCRIATMSEPTSSAIRAVETELRRRLPRGLQTAHRRRGVVHVVRMLNVMEPTVERRLLGELADADPQLAGEIRKVMFGVDVAACGRWPADQETVC
ncbi:MAG: hypothetical protein LLF97_11730 [Planctomycetaceae bacterium]|nr:hypothetical protein [Planctomycetaceae bacterium]